MSKKLQILIKYKINKLPLKRILIIGLLLWEYGYYGITHFQEIKETYRPSITLTKTEMVEAPSKKYKAILCYKKDKLQHLFLEIYLVDNKDKTKPFLYPEVTLNKFSGVSVKWISDLKLEIAYKDALISEFENNWYYSPNTGNYAGLTKIEIRLKKSTVATKK